MTEEEKQKEIAKIRAARQHLKRRKIGLDTEKKIKELFAFGDGCNPDEDEGLPELEDKKEIDIVKPAKTEKFLEDKQLNEDFNRDIESALEKYEETDKRIVYNSIRSYKSLCPIWNFSSARMVLSIALMELEYTKGILKMAHRKDGHGQKTGLTRDAAQSFSYMLNSIESAKEQIGIDPKSLKNKGDSSPAEAFADVVEKGNFDKRRFVCKAVIGEGKAKNKDSSSIGVAEFKNVSDEDVDEFLQKATN